MRAARNIDGLSNLNAFLIPFFISSWILGMEDSSRCGLIGILKRKMHHKTGIKCVIRFTQAEGCPQGSDQTL